MPPSRPASKQRVFRLGVPMQNAHCPKSHMRRASSSPAAMPSEAVAPAQTYAPLGSEKPAKRSSVYSAIVRRNPQVVVGEPGARDVLCVDGWPSSDGSKNVAQSRLLEPTLASVSFWMPSRAPWRSANPVRLLHSRRCCRTRQCVVLPAPTLAASALLGRVARRHAVPRTGRSRADRWSPDSRFRPPCASRRPWTLCMKRRPTAVS